MKIIYEDNSIIVIHKPAGLASQSANISQKDCVSLIKEHLKVSAKNTAGEPYVGVVHRLDQPVAGLLVFAKNQLAAAKLSKQVQSDIASKHYHALVEGKIDGEASDNELKCKMYKDSKLSKAVIVGVNNLASCPKGVKVQEAILYYTVEKYDEATDVSTIKVKLKTGRFHQIRAQLSGIGHPILGDGKYGATKSCPDDFPEKGDKAARGAIALVADELEFKHPDTGKIMHFSI